MTPGQDTRPEPSGAGVEGQGVAIATEGLVKRYRRGLFRPLRAVLDGIDLRVERGETVALLGPNGSGKSTLLRLISGAEASDEGRVRIFGQSPESTSARAALGCMGAAEDLPSELRGEELLQLFGAVAGFRAGELNQLIETALQRVGLALDGRTRIGRYSLGMKRRLALAAATFTSPSLLLLDEPSAGLDAPGHRVLTEVVLEAQARGAAILFASHQLDDLASFADRIVVLKQGRVIASGTPASLVDLTGSGRLELDGVDCQGLEELRRLAAEKGLRITGSGPGRDALQRLFAGPAAPNRDDTDGRGERE